MVLQRHCCIWVHNNQRYFKSWCLYCSLRANCKKRDCFGAKIRQSRRRKYCNLSQFIDNCSPNKVLAFWNFLIVVIMECSGLDFSNSQQTVVPVVPARCLCCPPLLLIFSVAFVAAYCSCCLHCLPSRLLRLLPLIVSYTQASSLFGISANVILI